MYNYLGFKEATYSNYNVQVLFF